MKGSGARRDTRNRTRLSILLLTAISVLLAALLLVVPRSASAPRPVAYAEERAASRPAPPAQPVERPTPAPESKTQTVERPAAEPERSVQPTRTPETVAVRPVVPPVAAPRRPEPEPPRAGKLFIIIDDVGYSLEKLDAFLAFPGRLTMAVLPLTPFAAEAARRIHASGNEVIVHQPMEPMGAEDPGPGAIFTSMAEGEIAAALERSFAAVPHAVGMNNHMGSRATADLRVMRIVAQFLNVSDRYFVDSVTTDRSVASAAALEAGVRFARRTALFLDNEGHRDAVAAAFERGVAEADSSGHAVMIGHVTTPALAAVLAERYRELTDAGYTFHVMSEYPFGGEGR